MAAEKKRSTSDGMLVSSYKRPKPEFRITENELPAIKNWTVGKKYKVLMDVEMVSQSKNSDDYYNDAEKGKHSASFKINSAKEQSEAK